MYCPNCGTENAADAAFCASCGTALQNAQSETVTEETAVEETVTEEVAVEELATEETAPITVEVTPAEEVEVKNSYPGKTLGMLGMIFSIAGWACYIVAPCLCGLTQPLGIPCIIASLILSIIGISMSKKADVSNVMGKVGLVLSIISLALVALIVVVYVLLVLALILFCCLRIFIFAFGSILAPPLMIFGM